MFFVVTEARGPCFSHGMGDPDQILLKHVHWLIIRHFLIEIKILLPSNGQLRLTSWFLGEWHRYYGKFAETHKWIIDMARCCSWFNCISSNKILVAKEIFEKCTVAMRCGPCLQHITGDTPRLNQAPCSFQIRHCHCGCWCFDVNVGANASACYQGDITMERTCSVFIKPGNLYPWINDFTENQSPVCNFVPTVTKSCDVWKGLSLHCNSVLPWWPFDCR